MTKSIREVLEAVVRDEAAVIHELCSLLTRTYQEKDVTFLPPIIEVISEWQNRPPRDILSELKKIEGNEVHPNACDRVRSSVNGRTGRDEL